MGSAWGFSHLFTCNCLARDPWVSPDSLSSPLPSWVLSCWVEVGRGWGYLRKCSLRVLGPHPQFQIQRGWSDPRICIFNKFLVDVVAAGPANTVRNQLISPLFKHHCHSYEIFQASCDFFMVPSCLLHAQGTGGLQNPTTPVLGS